MEPYIELNTKPRAEASYEFEKDFFKLMNDAVYRQTLMDVTKLGNFELMSDQRRYHWVQRKPCMIKNEKFTPSARIVKIFMLPTPTVVNKKIASLAWKRLKIK